MARGWESKEIESQIEAAEARSASAATPRPTPEQAARERELDSLKMSRTRVLQDLESSTNSGYQVMLKRSLAFLDEKISALEQT